MESSRKKRKRILAGIVNREPSLNFGLPRELDILVFQFALGTPREWATARVVCSGWHSVTSSAGAQANVPPPPLSMHGVDALLHQLDAGLVHHVRDLDLTAYRTICEFRDYVRVLNLLRQCSRLRRLNLPSISTIMANTHHAGEDQDHRCVRAKTELVVCLSGLKHLEVSISTKYEALALARLPSTLEVLHIHVSFATNDTVFAEAVKCANPVAFGSLCKLTVTSTSNRSDDVCCCRLLDSCSNLVELFQSRRIHQRLSFSRVLHPTSSRLPRETFCISDPTASSGSRRLAGSRPHIDFRIWEALDLVP